MATDIRAHAVERTLERATKYGWEIERRDADGIDLRTTVEDGVCRVRITPHGRWADYRYPGEEDFVPLNDVVLLEPLHKKPQWRDSQKERTRRFAPMLGIDPPWNPSVRYDLAVEALEHGWEIVAVAERRLTLELRNGEGCHELLLVAGCYNGRYPGGSDGEVMYTHPDESDFYPFRPVMADTIRATITNPGQRLHPDIAANQRQKYEGRRPTPWHRSY